MNSNPIQLRGAVMSIDFAQVVDFGEDDFWVIALDSIGKVLLYRIRDHVHTPSLHWYNRPCTGLEINEQYTHLVHMPNSKRIVLYTASGVLTGYIMDTSSKDGVVELQKIVEYEEHRYFEMEAIEAAEGCDGLFVTQRNKMLQYWKFDNPSPLWNQVLPFSTRVLRFHPRDPAVLFILPMDHLEPLHILNVRNSSSFNGFPLSNVKKVQHAPWLTTNSWHKTHPIVQSNPPQKRKYDTFTKKYISIFQCHQSSEMVYNLILDTNAFYTISSECIKKWSLQTLEGLSSFSIVSSRICTFANRFFYTYQEKSIQSFDTNSGTLSNFKCEPIRFVSISKNGQFLIYGKAGNQFKLQHALYTP